MECARGGRRWAGAGMGWWVWGRGQLTVIQKKLLHCLAASPYNLESQASQTEDVQSLPKEIEQREIEVKKAGTRERERGERWEVEREEDRVRRGCACVDVGCGAEVVDRGPLFLGIRLRQSSSSGPRNGKGEEGRAVGGCRRTKCES
jgi:hypothetical protein